MRIHLWLVLSLMMTAANARAESASQISNTNEIRNPDLTIWGEFPRPIRAVVFNPDGRLLAVADRDKTVGIFDARRGSRSTNGFGRISYEHRTKVVGIAFNGTNALALAWANQSVWIWEGSEGRGVAVHFGENAVTSFAPVGQPLLATAAGKQVTLWNYEKGWALTNFEANDSSVAAMAFTPDGKSLVIGTWKGVVRVLDVAAWKMTRIIDLDSPIHSLAVTTNCVLLGYGDGTVAMLKFEEQPSIPEVKKQSGAINAVAFSADGKRFASASADGTVKVWDAQAMKVICPLEGDGGEALCVAFSPDGREIVAGDGMGNVNGWWLK
ncbi:MAG TPA: hypothetical protein VN761_11500 [Candidatus Polarisedimenticolia bacterium]|nr:hypothetical protein [Candidatus Polarisedimenticolia bacterium]